MRNLSYESEFCMQFHFHANQSHFEFIRMVLHLDSLWNRGTGELGNGLLTDGTTVYKLIKLSYLVWFKCSNQEWMVPVWPWPGTLSCVLGQDTYSHSASLNSGIYKIGTSEFNAGDTLRWHSIPSTGSKNTPGHFMLLHETRISWQARWATWLVCRVTILTV